MATSRRRTFRRRARKRFLWTGLATGSTLINVAQTPAKTIVQLLTPSQVATIADMLVERVVLDFMVHSAIAETAARPVAAYLATVPTDVTETPVPEALWNPLDSDIDAMQKRPMWSRFFFAPTQDYGFAQMWSGTSDLMGSISEPVDINVKRKLGGDQALVFVISAVNPNTVMLMQGRALCSVGRK